MDPIHYNRDHIPVMLKGLFDVKFIENDIEDLVRDIYLEILRKTD